MNKDVGSRTGSPRQSDARRRTETFTNWFTIGGLVALMVIQFSVIGIYCAFLPSGSESAFAAASMVSVASYLFGALIGILFGIPRALTNETSNNAPSRRLFVENTNLEQVSDWLTKIIVGVSLVELGNIVAGIKDLARTVAPIFGSPTAQNEVMAGAMIIYSAIFGFIAGYIRARTVLTVVLYMAPSYIPGEESDE